MNSNSIKVLVIDSNEGVYHMINILLSESLFEFKIDWCPNYNVALEKLDEGEHDVYLIEYDLADKTGVDLIKEAERTFRSRPIIILTSSTDTNAESESIANGASDFLRKSQLTAISLERSIRYARGRQNSYEKLKEERTKYLKLFMEGADPIILCDLDFTIYEHNESFSLLVGTTALNKTLELSNLILDDTILDSFKQTVVKMKSYKNYEIQLHTDDGLLDCLVTVTAIMELGGEPQGYQIIFRDITSYKQAGKVRLEEDKRSYTDKLAQMIAHEVRNPLTNIDLAVSQLSELDDPDPEDREVYFDIVRRNSLRINALISQLLDSSKPAVLNKDETFLHKVIANAIELCKDRMLLKDVQLVLNVNESNAPIVLDSEKMEIALLNIMTNALEAMNAKEHPILSVELEYRPNTAVITLSDNGKGMTTEQVGQVFEPFFTARTGGKGLGMTLTKNIIRSHNGDIQIQSTLNEGTTFTIILPFNNPLT